ncbi:hypothetical protein PG993_013373 [Apiospora rasikravindrae]|uniref:Uncharacterized protein n=1 Tax=Apiospora rasikravindrae TaxID=990691 RepID=A0ABR1RXG9_9PEZI
MEFPGEAALIANSEAISAGHAVDGTHCEGLSFAPEMLPSQSHEFQEAPGRPDNRIYTDQIVNHVRCDTFANIWRCTDMLWGKYAAVGWPRSGRFMVRYGSQAVYFDTMANVAAFSKPKSNKQKAEVAKMDVALLYEK